MFIYNVLAWCNVCFPVFPTKPHHTKSYVHSWIIKVFVGVHLAKEYGQGGVQSSDQQNHPEDRWTKRKGHQIKYVVVVSLGSNMGEGKQKHTSSPSVVLLEWDVFKIMCKSRDIRRLIGINTSIDRLTNPWGCAWSCSPQKIQTSNDWPWLTCPEKKKKTHNLRLFTPPGPPKKTIHSNSGLGMHEEWDKSNEGQEKSRDQGCFLRHDFCWLVGVGWTHGPCIALGNNDDNTWG